jgi:hypothetical protein
MDAPAVDHDIDTVAKIAIGETLDRNSMLGELLAGLQLAGPVTGEASKTAMS